MDSNSTDWLPSEVHVWPFEPDKGHDVWNFDFAVQGINEEQASELADKVMLVLCGGGWFRHTRIGRFLLGCKRLVAGGEWPSRKDGSSE